MSEKRRLAEAVILPTKDELDERAERQRQWETLLGRMRGYSSTLAAFKGVSPLETWRESYVSGAVDFETFEAGLAERLR